MLFFLSLTKQTVTKQRYLSFCTSDEKYSKVVFFFCVHFVRASIKTRLWQERTRSLAIVQGMWSFLSDKSLFQSDVKSETATFSTRSHNGNEKSKWSSTTTSLTSRGEMSLLKKHTARRCHSKSPQLLSGHGKSPT